MLQRLTVDLDTMSPRSHERRFSTRSARPAGRIARATCPAAALLGLLGATACSIGTDPNTRGPGLGWAHDDDGEPEPVPAEEQTFTLRLDDAVPPPLELAMSREEVAELFGERARDITLLELDPTPMLADALLAVRDSCGLAWQQDDPNPGHDCSLTPLGQTFQGSDGTWQTSPEYAMVRLLTMTPANVVVEGTTSQGLAELADSMPLLIGSYGTVLSDALGIPRTQTVVSNQALVTAFRECFVQTHPAALPDGALAITLEDALSDMATVGTRLGPAGDHPGIVDPSEPVRGQVFGPGFTMVAVAESNLHPPQDQFVWETVLEVAQVALHHTPFAAFPEGGADVAFTLEGVDVGLTGSEAADAVRPFLMEQSAEISDYLLGNVYEDNVGIDFYYRRGEDGTPYAFFVAASDLPEGTADSHPTPGFFAGPELEPDDKLSRREIVGVADTEHEKLEIGEGETIAYFADEDGQPWRARFVNDGDDSAIEVSLGALPP